MTIWMDPQVLQSSSRVKHNEAALAIITIITFQLPVSLRLNDQHLPRQWS